MNILITGGYGFIGKSLYEYLKQQHKYILFRPKKKEMDLIKEEEVDSYIKSHNIDIIIHTANKGGGRDSLDFNNVMEYNLRMFFNIVKHEKNVKKIISFGSGAEYGKHKPIVSAKEEEYLSALPLDAYGFYKSVTSRYIMKSDKVVQLRIFGAYGKYENYRFKFISNAIVKNLLQLPITIKQNVYFDYIYIKDLVQIIEWFIENNSKENIYNVSTGKKVDLLTLANLINKCSDFKSEIKIISEGLNNEYTANNDKLMGEIKDFDFTTHERAIQELQEYFSKNLKDLDVKEVVEDIYLEKISDIWKVKSEEI